MERLPAHNTCPAQNFPIDLAIYFHLYLAALRRFAERSTSTFCTSVREFSPIERTARSNLTNFPRRLALVLITHG